MLLACPTGVWAAGEETTAQVPVWLCIPFAGLLLCIAIMPLIKAETIEKMLVAFKAFYLNEKSILCSSYKGQRGNPVIFSAAYKQELLSLEGDVGGRQVINKHLSQVATYEVQCEEELFDIDTQSAYNKLLQGQFSFKKCE